MAYPFEKHTEKFDRRGIGPMEILEEQQNRQSCRARFEMTHNGLERLRVPLRRCEGRHQAALIGRQPQERGKQGNELGRGLDIALEQRFELRKLLERIVARAKARGTLQLSDHWMKGARGAFGRTLVGHQPIPAIGSELLPQRLHQP